MNNLHIFTGKLLQSSFQCINTQIDSDQVRQGIDLFGDRSDEMIVEQIECPQMTKQPNLGWNRTPNAHCCHINLNNRFVVWITSYSFPRTSFGRSKNIEWDIYYMKYTTIKINQHSPGNSISGFHPERWAPQACASFPWSRDKRISASGCAPAIFHTQQQQHTHTSRAFSNSQCSQKLVWLITFLLRHQHYTFSTNNTNKLTDTNKLSINQSIYRRLLVMRGRIRCTTKRKIEMGLVCLSPLDKFRAIVSLVKIFRCLGIDPVIQQ